MSSREPNDMAKDLREDTDSDPGTFQVKTKSSVPPFERREKQAGVFVGALAGAVVGAIAGPAGVLAGSAVGAAMGAVAGAAMDKSEALRDHREKVLDEVIGITRGSMGAGRPIRVKESSMLDLLETGLASEPAVADAPSPSEPRVAGHAPAASRVALAEGVPHSRVERDPFAPTAEEAAAAPPKVAAKEDDAFAVPIFEDPLPGETTVAVEVPKEILEHLSEDPPATRPCVPMFDGEPRVERDTVSVKMAFDTHGRESNPGPAAFVGSSS